MEKILIAAAAENDVIGLNDDLPWPNIKEDMRRFRQLTSGHTVIQGRKTYESIYKRIGKPLPNRKNIVLSRNMESKEGILVARTLIEAIEMAEAERGDAYIIGGEQIYKTFMPIATKIELTRIHKNYEGDAFFPKINKRQWSLLNREDLTGEVGIPFSFETYENVIKRYKPYFIKLAAETADNLGEKLHELKSTRLPFGFFWNDVMGSGKSSWALIRFEPYSREQHPSYSISSETALKRAIAYLEKSGFKAKTIDFEEMMDKIE